MMECPQRMWSESCRFTVNGVVKDGWEIPELGDKCPAVLGVLEGNSTGDISG